MELAIRKDIENETYNIIESSYKTFASIANALSTVDLPRNMGGGSKRPQEKDT